MICEKCGELIHEGAPYCSSVKCLTKVILGVTLSPDAGYLTQVDGFKYPMRGFPKEFDLHMVDVLKRVIISTVRFFENLPITPQRMLKGISVWMGEVYMASFRPHEQRKDEEYSESSREIRRVLLKLNPYESSDWVRYLVDIWETDQAYRFRGQDIIPETDFDNLKKSPRKEILRLIDLMTARESKKWGGQLPKMKALRRVASLAFRLGFIRRPVVIFLEELDMDKIRLNINDRYWCANKFDYDYEGKTYDERMAWKNEEDSNWEKPIIQADKPRIAIQPPNQQFYDLSMSEAQKMADETSRLLMENWREMQK